MASPCTPSQADSWQRMKTIVSQHPLFLQSNLAKYNQKIFYQRLVSENILVFLLQYIGLSFSTVTPHPMPLWFASGTACAFMFMRGYSVLPGIACGTILAFLLAGASIMQAFLCAIIFSAQAFLLLWGSYRYISPTLVFYQKWVGVKFLFYSFILTCLTSIALTSVLHAMSAHMILKAWLANFNGVVIFSCAIVSWDLYFPQIDLLRQKNLFILGLVYGILFVCTLMLLLVPHFLIVSSCLFIIMMIISICYRWCGAVSALFVVALILSLGMSLGALFFTSSTLLLQVFLCVTTVIGLVVGIHSGLHEKNSCLSS